MRIKKQRVIFKGRIFNVLRGTKVLPNGIRAYCEEIKHSGSALVVPFLGNKIVFIRQYRPVIDKYLWEMPAGKLDKGESLYRCAKREVEEETGFIVKDLKKIGFIYTSPGFCNEKITIFKARCVKRQKANRERDELIKVYTLERNQIQKLFKEGKITDSKTIAALAFIGILK